MKGTIFNYSQDLSTPSEATFVLALRRHDPIHLVSGEYWQRDADYSG